MQLAGPFSRTALTTSASYELRSPKRLQVRFERGTVATPELLQDVELPASVTVLGQPIDLTPVKARPGAQRQCLGGSVLWPQPAPQVGRRSWPADVAVTMRPAS